MIGIELRDESALMLFSDLVIAGRQQIAHDLPIVFLVLDHQNSLAHAGLAAL
jgi:hypothetical protein